MNNEKWKNWCQKKLLWSSFQKCFESSITPFKWIEHQTFTKIIVFFVATGFWNDYLRIDVFLVRS